MQRLKRVENLEGKLHSIPNFLALKQNFNIELRL